LSQHGVQPLPPLRFPTLAELANETTPAPPSKPQTLFNMVGDPALLFNDLLDNPEKYGEGVDTLLQQLVQGQKKLEDLNAQDVQLLNNAAVSFVQAPSKKAAPLPRRRVQPAKPEESDLDEHGAPVPSEELVLPEAPSFWWKR
jgi:hypothetical protein